MGSGNVRWLLGELPGLVTRGVLDAGAAERLRAHYSMSGGPRRSWVTIGLAVLGAAAIGAGAVLVLAHNWDALGRPARVGIVLGLLIVAQALAAFAAWRRPASVAWREGSAAGWVLATGAALGLVTQTYHLWVEPGEFLLSWTLLALPVVWLMRSSVATALAWCGAGSAVIVGRLAALDESAVFWGLAALLAPAMAWFASRGDRLAVLPFCAAAFWLPVAGIALVQPFGDASWKLYFPALFAGMYALGTHGAAAGRSTAWRIPAWTVGAAGAGAMLLVLSFTDPWTSTELATRERVLGPAILLSVAAAATVLAGWRVIEASRRRDGTTALLAAVPIGVAVLFVARLGGLPAEVAALACSAWLFTIGVLALVEGARQSRIGLANAGLAFLAALAIARFFDADLSLLSRGIGFVSVGLAFLATNLWIVRRPRPCANGGNA